MAMVPRSILIVHDPASLTLGGSEDADVILMKPDIGSGLIDLPPADSGLCYTIRNMSPSGKTVSINADGTDKIEGVAMQTFTLGPNRIVVLQGTDFDADPGWFIVGGDFSQSEPAFDKTAYRQGGYISSSG